MSRRKATVFSDDDATALGLPPDPEPTPVKRGPGRPRKTTTTTTVRHRSPSTGRAVSKATLIAQVRDEVALYLEIAVVGWELRDPECASSMDAQVIGKVADKIASIIGRNDRILALATKGGLLADVVGLVAALKPVAVAVYRAHGPGGHGHHALTEDDYAQQFPAYHPHG